MTRRSFSLSSFAVGALAACTRAIGGANADAPSGAAPQPGFPELPADPPDISPLVKSEGEWKAVLDAQGFHVLRNKGTERAFSGRYWNNHADGTYVCAGCALHLFDAADKFESGTGWPSFTRPVHANRVKIGRDDTLGMSRDEVTCARCDGHLGHVFDDGPAPTGQRFCMNSVSLVFRAKA